MKEKQMAILTDTTKCIGCEECVAACKRTNNTGKDRPWRWQKNINDLSASRWTTIIKKPDNHYIRQHCRHCLESACASACPVGALHQTPEGAVIYDKDKCMGCRYCMMACPFGLPRYSWHDSVSYVQKCILCYDKIQSGELKEPACTSACPANATIYGERDELLAFAHTMVRRNPDKYVQKVFGEKEFGGSAVMYISDIDLGFLGFHKKQGTQSLPELTWGALKSVPGVFFGVGTVMAGLHWIIDRRIRLQQVNGDESKLVESGEAVEKKDEE